MAFVRIMVLIWADMLATYVTWIMQTYLTDVWKLGFTHAAGIMNVSTGLSKFFPLVMFFLVDFGLGNYWMLLLSSIAFSIGLGFLSMSTPPVLHKATHTCSDYQPNCIGHTQKALFYTALVLVAVGISGHIVSLVAYAFDQLVVGSTSRSQQQQNNQSLWCQRQRRRGRARTIMSESLARSVEENTRQQPNDTLNDDLLKLQFQPLEAMLELVNRNRERNGGGISDKRLCGVICVLILGVAGLIALPYIKPWERRFGFPAILTLAATLIFLYGSWDGINRRSSDRPVIRSGTQAQERRVLIRMLPIWFTCILCGVVTSVGNTYFVEQAKNMNYKVGVLKFPNSILLVLYGAAKTFFKSTYDYVANFLGGNRQYAPLIGIALAAIFSGLCCIIAAVIETRRIHVIRSHGLVDKPDEKIPMSVFWILPQYIVLGGLDSFYENSMASFLSDQSPESMKKFLVYLNPGLSGLGIVGSVLSVNVVGKISEKLGKRSWFQHDLNESRLDNYYWVLAGLSAVNFFFFLSTAICFPFPYTEPVSSEQQNRNEDDYGPE